MCRGHDHDKGDQRAKKWTGAEGKETYKNHMRIANKATNKKMQSNMRYERRTQIRFDSMRIATIDYAPLPSPPPFSAVLRLLRLGSSGGFRASDANNRSSQYSSSYFAFFITHFIRIYLLFFLFAVGRPLQKLHRPKSQYARSIFAFASIIFSDSLESPPQAAIFHACTLHSAPSPPSTAPSHNNDNCNRQQNNDGGAARERDEKRGENNIRESNR